MRSKTKIIVRVLSIVLACMLVIPPLLVFADEDKPSSSSDTGSSSSGGGNEETTDYAKRAGAMFNYFRDTSVTGNVNDISVGEFRAFGVLLSNYMIPFGTDITKIADTIKVGSGENEYNAWDRFLDTWGRDGSSEMLDTLLSKYNSAINGGMKQLYYKGGDKKEYKAKLNCIFNTHILAYNNKGSDGKFVDNTDPLDGFDNKTANYVDLYWGDDTNNIVFSTKSHICRTVALLMLCSAKISNNDTINNSYLYVSPFGDICVKGGTTGENYYVVVPACVNPYTYSADGSKLYINNSFFLGNLVSWDTLEYYGEIELLKNDNIANFFETSHVNDLKNFLKLGKNSSYPFYKWYDVYLGDTLNEKERIPDVTEMGDKQYDISGWTTRLIQYYSDYNNGNGYKGYRTNVMTRIDIDNKLVNSNIYFFNSTGGKYLINPATLFNPLYELVHNQMDEKFADKGITGYEAGIYLDGAKITGTTSYFTYWSSIWDTNDAEATEFFKKQFWNLFGWGDNTETPNRLTLMQVPMDKVVDRVALFNMNGDIVSFNDSSSKVTAIKDVGVLSDDTLTDTTTPQDLIGKDTWTNSNDKPFFTEELTTVKNSIVRVLKDDAFQVGDDTALIANNANFWAGIYWVYLEDLAGLKLDNETGKITAGDAPTFDWLPSLPDKLGFQDKILSQISQGGTETSTDTAKKQQSIIDWTYAILNAANPNNNYLVSWLKSIVDGMFISLHNSILGISLNLSTYGQFNTDSSSGSKYTVIGYITTPQVTDLPVISWIINNYNIVYIFLMVLVAVILIILTVSKMRTVTQSVLLFILMGAVMLVPAELINWSITVSNNISESMYSDKFLYWAIVQHAETVYNIGSADSSEEELAIENVTASQQMSGKGITLKWLSPKKNGLVKKIENSADADAPLTLFKHLANNLFNGETYVSANSTYMYRTYNSIYSNAKNGYMALSNGAYSDTDTRSDNNYNMLSAGIKGSWCKTLGFTGDSRYTKLYNFFSEHDVSSPDGKAFTVLSVMGGKRGDVTIPVGYTMGYLSGGGSVQDAIRNQYSSYDRIYSVLTNSDVVKALFNFDIDKVDFTSSNMQGLTVDGSTTDSATTPKDEFFNYTESPYYYFYGVFSDAVAKNGGAYIQGGNDLVHVLLSEDFFRVTDQSSIAYGELKDYLDLEGLFTYIIPFLNYGNNDFKQYENKYGLTVQRSGYTEAEYTARIKQLEAMYNIYSPWVDALYTANSTSERAKIGYDTVDISDPLNPASYYYKGRPMSFSPAQARIYSYSDLDLTNVESKINRVLEKTREDLLELLNYRDFAKLSVNGSDTVDGNEVIVSAAAMLATFNFNAEFSNSTMFSSTTLYPLSFELRDMNYDSFLRLIIANSTNQVISANSNASVYTDVIHNNSAITSSALILVDILAVFAIPTMKIVLIIVMLGLGIFLAITCIISKPDKVFGTILRSFMLPVGLMALIFIGHSLLVSWFMNSGVNNGITYGGISFTTGDLTITLLLLLIVDCVTVFCMVKLFKFSAKKAYGYAKLATGIVLGGIAGVAGAAGALGRRALGAGATYVGNAFKHVAHDTAVYWSKNERHKRAVTESEYTEAKEKRRRKKHEAKLNLNDEQVQAKEQGQAKGQEPVQVSVQINVQGQEPSTGKSSTKSSRGSKSSGNGTGSGASGNSGGSKTSREADGRNNTAFTFSTTDLDKGVTKIESDVTVHVKPEPTETSGKASKSRRSGGDYAKKRVKVNAKKSNTDADSNNSNKK